jgi:hypothetical protein
MTDDQAQLFNPERYSPVTIAVLLRLPESNARAFIVASALGRIFRRDGAFEPLATAKSAGGIVVGPKQRRRVLAALGISPRRWNQLVADWTSRYVAHRCGPGTACLFVRPLEARCPACLSEIPIPAHAPRPDARRHKGSITSRQKEASLPKTGTNSSRWGEPTLPDSNGKVMHPKPGFLQGLEVGVAEEAQDSKPEGSNGLQEVPGPGSSKIGAALSEEDEASALKRVKQLLNAREASRGTS